MITRGAAARRRHQSPARRRLPTHAVAAGTRVLRRLQHLQNTALYPEYRRNQATLCPAGAPQSHVRPGNSDLEPKEGRSGCENTLLRGLRVHSAPRPPFSPAPLAPTSPQHPGRNPPFPTALRTAAAAKWGRRKGYSYSISERVLFPVPRVLD